ncbi:MAG: 3-phosphoshikimate 1-carboxyvinyltransferase [Bacteroidales bacterium]|jgi:3-phosphoshikimate 1-carboxyvinyltransferase|nr:3-phosphoshikimate 1-carboxyvinyltransferase [Bacteroidales bacterium]
MERSVEPSFITGEIKAPPSKSMTQRAIAAALLAEGESIIVNPSYCDDSLAAMSIAVSLGSRVEPGPDNMRITGSRELKETKLNCGESGLAIRLFSPIASLFDAEITVTGAGSLKKRPMTMIEDALRQFGVECITTGGLLPLTVRGPLRGGECDIDGSISSQLLTGLLMSLPVTEQDSVVRVRNLKSKPYISMTLEVLKDFGIEVSNEDFGIFRIPGRQKYLPRTWEVESDWSGGAFLLVAGAINGDLKVTGLRTGSTQSDMAVLNALHSAGVKMKISGDKIEVSKSELKAFEFDATESPDIFPPLVALAAYCDGVTRIKGATRLVHKESDRAQALCEEFDKMGIKINLLGDILTVEGGKVRGAHVSSHEDHRIAMAAAVAALGAEGTVYIKDSHAVGKSYPAFYDDLVRAGAVINE